MTVGTFEKPFQGITVRGPSGRSVPLPDDFLHLVKVRLTDDGVMRPFIDDLKYMYDARFCWCNPGETGRANKKGHRDIGHMAADIKKSLAAQRTLAMMDRTQFQIFTSDELRA